MTDTEKVRSHLMTMAAMIIEDIDILRLIAREPPSAQELATVRGQIAEVATLIAAAEAIERISLD